jgi:HEPN domain-containing protein
MPRKRLPPNDPREWLNRAQSNLARSRNPLAGAYLEDYCFDAQQAAEKAIKAVFIAHGLTFPYLHDLGRLLGLLAQAGIRVPKYVSESHRLTRFAVEARYPGVSGPATKLDHRRAVRVASGVLRWATRQVERHCPRGEPPFVLE